MKLFALEAVLLGALVSMVGATDHAGEMKSEMKYDMGTATPPMKKVTDGSGSNGYGKGNAYGNGNAYNPIPMDKPAEKSVEAVSVPVEAKAEMKVEGEKANENIMVISQNWGDNKGEMVVSAASPGGTVHTVMVGGEGLVYTPDTIVAAVGDKVLFMFGMKNHTVTQSTFEKPCVKMASGVDSGFMPNPNGTMNPPPSYMFEVKTTAATWFYCKQKTGTHCGKGMVFSINPTPEKSQAIFKQMAIQQNGTEAANNTASMTASVSVSVSVSATTTAAPSAATTTAADLSASTTTAAAAVPSSSTTVASPDVAQPSGVVNLAPGQGAAGDGGQCSCTCLCGAESFPSGMGQGHWGGWGGAIPMQAQQLNVAAGAVPEKPYR